MPRFLIFLGLAASGFWMLYGSIPPPFAPPPRPQAAIAANAVRFDDVALLAGIHFQHIQRTEALDGLDDTLGAGACAADFNNDGWLDIFLVGGNGHTRHYGRKSWWLAQQGHALYLNSGEGYFLDATPESGLSGDVHGMGCLAADLNNDGNIDIFVTTKGKNQLFRNLGPGKFQDVSQHMDAAGAAWSTGAIAVDVNGDGLLDIFVANYLAYDRLFNTFERDSGFRQAVPRGFKPDLFDGVANTLWINRGNFQFTEEAASRGITDATGRSLGALTLDHDADNCPDLLVMNDTGSPNKFYRNDCRGTFKEEVLAELPVQSDSGRFAIPIRLADADGDALMINRKAGDGSVVLNNGKDSAWDIAVNTDVLLANDRWGAAVADFDGNGLDDLFVAQGLATPSLDTYAIPQGQANSLFLQTSGGNGSHFVHHPVPGRDSSRTAVSGDFNNDGKPDVLVTQNNGAPALLINRTERHANWLGLTLSPPTATFRAAQVTVVTREKTFHRPALPPPAFLGSHDPRLLFTLPTETELVDVVVTTTGGRRLHYPRLPVNRYHSLDITSGDSNSKPTDGDWTPQLNRLEKAVVEGGDDARHLYALLVAAAPSSRDLAILDQLLDDNRPQTLELIHRLSEKNAPSLLPLYNKWLDSDYTEKRLAGITALENLEDDTAIRKLVNLLQHDDVTTVCRTSKVFQKLFRKEEAAIHSKWLAMSDLIRLAIGESRERQICALDALAEAEHIRSVDALMDRLNDSDAMVQAKMIRVLGRTRRKEIIPALTRLLQRTQEGIIAAESLIALKRVADPDITLAWTRFFDRDDPGTRLSALAHLLTQPDGTVFPRETLIGETRRLLAAMHWRTLPSRPLADMLKLMRVAGQYPDALQVPAFTSHDDPDVRLEAYLLSVQREQSIDTAKIALRDSDDHVRSTFVEFARLTAWPGQADTLENLLIDPLTRPYAPLLMDNLAPDDRARFIVSALRYSGEPDSWYRTIAESCQTSGSQARLPQAYFRVSQQEHLRTNVYCGLNAGFMSLTATERDAVIRHLLTKNKALLLDWLSHARRTTSAQQTITQTLQIAGSEGLADEVMVATAWLGAGYDARMVQRFPFLRPHLKEAALMKLETPVVNQPFQQLVERTAASASENLTTRLCAALLLMRGGNLQARELLTL